VLKKKWEPVISACIIRSYKAHNPKVAGQSAAADCPRYKEKILGLLVGDFLFAVTGKELKSS
jgi:hypothetical protein